MDSIKDIESTEEQKMELIVDFETDNRLLYGATDRPPLSVAIMCAFQNALVTLPSVIAISLLVVDVTCATTEDDIKTRLMSSSLLMCGICTVLMCLIGCRLPLFQSSASDFLVPLLAMQVLNPKSCEVNMKGSTNTTGMLNISLTGNISTQEDRTEFTLNNIRELQGSLIVAGTFQFLLGATGLVSLLLRFIGPITIVPTLLLTVYYMVRACVKFAKVHWGVAVVVIVISIILSLYLGNRKMSVPVWTRKSGFRIIRYPLHQVFSILIAIFVGWFLCGILTWTDIFSKDNIYARTDSRMYIVKDARWFIFPYPGQFGPISFSVPVFTGFFIGTLTSVLDSIGDYYACAKMCDLSPPPSHAVNRGIAIEGLCSLVAGFLGCGHATTTNGGTIGAIGVTRVGSRDVFLATGIIYITFAFIGKISAFFIIIPYPVLGGSIVVLFGMFAGVVLSNLQVISLNSTRNLAILGISLLFGLMMPYYIETEPDSIKTGSEYGDGILKMLLANPNLCAGVVACFLDNTVYGTLEERGISAWRKLINENSDRLNNKSNSIYDIYLPTKVKNSRCIRRLPFIQPL